MKKKLLHYLALIILLSFFSCAPIYIPNTTNAPLFSEQGDFNVGMHAGTNGFDLQTAIAVSDNVAIMINGSMASQHDADSTDAHEHLFGEFGLGFYQPISTNGRFELYGGFGSGRGASYDTYEFFTTSSTYASGYYHRFFIQSNIGATTDIFDGGFSMRFAPVYFYKYRSSGEAIERSDFSSFIEPSIFARVGWKNIKFQTQIGFSFPMFESQVIDYQPFMFSIGLNYRFNLSKGFEPGPM